VDGVVTGPIILLQTLYDFKITAVNKSFPVLHDIARKVAVAPDALGVAVVGVKSKVRSRAS
jgi:hypothetical protein